jgi:hypothetical protein
MEFVMVPVPEEHVVDVMLYVTRLVQRAGVEPWTDESVQEFFDEVDEASRSLLSLVARHTAAGRELSEEESAETLELSVREIRAITRDIYDATQKTKRLGLLGTRDASIVLPNGRTVEKRVFTMTDQVSRMIRAYERASLAQEHRADPSPSE